VPFISGIFSILLMFVGVASFFPAVSSIILYLPSVVWSAVLLLFEGVDFSSVMLSGIKISIGAAMCYYGGWLFLTDKWNISKRMRILLFGLLFLCFVFSCFFL
jgi:hypothetical protein